MESIIKHLSENDDILKRLSLDIPFPIIANTQNVFQDLLSCIIEQQIHYRSTKKVFQKMMSLASLDNLTVENFDLLEQKGFQNIKLSARKYESILGTVEFFKQNKIDWFQLKENEIRTVLSQIKGVGNWSIDMILLYTLDKPNIFPSDDYHLRMVMTKLYDIDTSASIKAQQKAIAEKWAPYRSYGVKYLLAWKKLQKKGVI